MTVFAGNGGNGFLWQRKTEGEVDRNLLDSKLLNMWMEDLRCNEDKDVSKARGKRAEVEEKQGREPMLKDVSRPVTSPAVLERRFLNKLFHTDITNAAAHWDGGGDNDNTIPVSPPKADTFTRMPIARDESEKPVVNDNDVADRKKRRKKNKKQRAKLRKQKQKPNEAKDSEAPDEDSAEQIPSIIKAYHEEHTILKMQFQNPCA